MNVPKKIFASLDELYAAYPAGTRIKYTTASYERGEGGFGVGMVYGVQWGLPLVVGGPDQVALVVKAERGVSAGAIVSIYPHEVLD